MKKEEPSIAEDWLKIARKDWQRIGRNLRARDLEAAAFFLQQSLEKYLKAFLLSRQWKLRRIHELDALLDEAVRHDSALEVFRDLCERVSAARNFVKTMFPDEKLGRA
jgi:HEPN domain-containing protein